MADCLFCRISAGEMDSYAVYESGDAYAFLDVNPVSRGHTLVVPKTHAATLPALDDAAAQGLFTAVKQVVDVVDAELQPAGINVLQNNGAAAGQEIDHVHVHVVPRYGADDGIRLSFDQGELEEDEAAALARRLQQ